jgi:hypothetical protein
VTAPEVVIIDLPLSVDAMVAITDGLCAMWPECQVRQHPSKLIVELSGPRVEDSE